MGDISDLFRRTSVEQILAGQRAYVEQTANLACFGLMIPEAFVRGIRDLGYRHNGDAVAELIDNAIQAHADRVDVLFGYEGAHTANRPSQLAVVDNGHGMLPEMIRMAVMWGGTHRENDRKGLGRYGYGLPCSSVSLGRRFTVFSQVAGESLYAATLDLDDIAYGSSLSRNGMAAPEPRPATLPSFVSDQVRSAYGSEWISGTAVLVEKLDRLEWSTDRGLRGNLSRKFGVIYHKLCRNVSLFVDGVPVKPCDPLFLTPGFHLHEIDDDRACNLHPTHVEVCHPENSVHLGTVTLRYAWLPPSFGSIDKSRDAVGMNANARFGIMRDYNGVIFSRNGRLIDVQTRTPWTTFINNDRYIKVEVEFTATLDEWFGITTSKQQVAISPFIWDLLKGAGLPKAIEQLRAKVRLAKLARKAENFSSRGPCEQTSEPMRAATAEFATNFPEQCDFGFRTAPYRLALQYDAAAPFFTVEREAGIGILKLNTAHIFYERIFGAPDCPAELRSALEVLLFCMGDVFLKLPAPYRAQCSVHLQAWLRKLAAVLPALVLRRDGPDEVHS